MRVPTLSSVGRDRVSTALQEGPLCGQAGISLTGRDRWTGQDTPTRKSQTDRSGSAAQEWSRGQVRICRPGRVRQTGQDMPTRKSQTDRSGSAVQEWSRGQVRMSQPEKGEADRSG